jgi:class 3 adenylate cyclase/tetratricopeptide (TPR) repeat protein
VASPTAVDRAGEERKVVSVLFCDLVGFTAASEFADPEDVRARLLAYHARVSDQLVAFGGTVEKFIGDAVVAVFGAPKVHEDDAERAVRAGLRIVDVIAELNEAQPDRDLAVRIGINTGEGVVSVPRARDASHGLVIGDVINTAARIQAAAPVNGIAVGAATFRATAHIVDYEPLDPTRVKGKRDALELWRAVSPVRSTGGNSRRSGARTLVGRTHELASLVRLFDRTCADRSTQLVTVIGEPGVGKSRLVTEFRDQVDARLKDVTWRQGGCLAYGDRITFWALSEVVKAHAGVVDSDSTDAVTAKLDATLPDSPDTAWLRARLLPLLGVTSVATESRDESFIAWQRYVESFAATSAAVVIIEDLHWADEALLDFLTHLAGCSTNVPLLVMCTTRPELLERRSSWTSMPNSTPLWLSRLSDNDTAALIGMLLDGAVLPEQAQQALIERADGNPLYAEEYVRMVRDQGVLDQTSDPPEALRAVVPHTVQALIAARLDTLPPEHKAVLQAASVLGEVFWPGALTAMGDLAPAQLGDILLELRTRDFVRSQTASSVVGESELSFWHALVRDTVYGQIPRARRTALHVAAAEWFTIRSIGRPQEYADIQAYHLMTAYDLAMASSDLPLVEQLKPRARDQALLAADKSMNLDALRAMQLVDRALALTTDDDDRLPDVLLRWAVAATAARRLDDAQAALERALDGFHRRGNAIGNARALRQLAIVRHWHGDSEHYVADEEAVELLQPLPPSPDLVAALSGLASGYAVNGRYDDAVSVATRALAAAEELKLQVPIEALATRGYARVQLGDLRGLNDQEEAVAQGLARGESRQTAVTWGNLGMCTRVTDGPVRALTVIREAHAFARRHGQFAVADNISVILLAPLIEAGHLVRAITDGTAHLAQLEVAQNVWGQPIVLAALAQAGNQIDHPQARVWAEKSLTAARSLGEPEVLVGSLTAAAVVRAASGETNAAHDLLDELASSLDVPRGEFACHSSAAARCAIEVGDTDLCRRLMEPVTPALPVGKYALAAASGLIAEADADLDTAAALFADAAGHWEAFGNLLETAYALLGQGRCEQELGDPAAADTLSRARDMFDGMGAAPRRDECERLLAATTT